jgi:hypothetical protein
VVFFGTGSSPCSGSYGSYYRTIALKIAYQLVIIQEDGMSYYMQHNLIGFIDRPSHAARSGVVELFSQINLSLR